ncbi:DUF1311 domain-containing protein [filamentous cyanobacterium LEGE 11480]|uniref:DUF1311 domain-containing protein n=1 Tax=Romeriopsis navalis LEGE 11480 TaxID=2777977 RepID=A0A928Z3L9_9CYAN|nr:lysozyme inhibitor LprI family protein [Romeriopsis navalis]MBE9029435.1 DUF1311 domain-containing protein [Romeriopsis navalis LEGE 11480]
MKSWKFGLVGIGLVVAMGGGAIIQNASTVNAQPQGPNCQNPTTQLAMNICAARDAERSDRQLNQAYQKVRQTYRSYSDLPKYRAMRLKKLTDAQLAWIKYRDTNCKWQTSKYDGGSIQPLIYASCVKKMTDQRTQELLDSLNP